MVNVYAPAVVGVPLNNPVDENPTPGGSVDSSLTKVHVSVDGQHPESCREKKKNPWVPTPRLLASKMLTVPVPAPLMKKPFDICSVLPAGSVESVNFAARLKLPLSCGVPATVSVSPSSVSPTGS